MRLRVCPFSVAVFFGTVVLVTWQKRRASSRCKRSNSKQQPDDNDTDNGISFHVVFVLGAPGVGKGTQCQLLTQRLGTVTTPVRTKWIHLSAGDLLRAERSKGDSLLAQKIEACLVAGQLVKSEITTQLLANAMQRHWEQDNVSHFLVDGFPRSFDNWRAWQENTMCARSTKILFVLDFVCPQEILVGRLLERERADDNLATVQKRFDTFERETAPMLAYFRNATTVPVYTITADQPVERVYQETSQYLEHIEAM